jgi:cardiolipin synthase (CMP-forming)
MPAAQPEARALEPTKARALERPPWTGWREISARDLVRVPGLLSLARVPLAALFPLTLRRPALGLGVLALAGVSDVLDGWYARRFHQQTSTGALLDGVTDKVFALAVVTSLLASGSLSIVETLLLGTREIGEIVIGLRLAAEPGIRRRVKVPSANAGGKIATTLQYAAIAAILLGSPRRSLLVGATAVAGLVASISYWKRDVEEVLASPVSVR